MSKSLNRAFGGIYSFLAQKPSYGVIAVFFVTVSLRFIQLILSHHFFPFEYLVYDSVYYDGYAREIAGIESIGAFPVGISSVYVLFVSWIYALFGANILFVGAIQCVLAGLTAVFLCQMTRDIFSGRAGVYAGLFYALSPILIYLDPLMLKPVLVNFFLVLGLRFLQLAHKGMSRGLFCLSGFCLASAAIMRMQILLFFPFIGLLLLWLVIKNKDRRLFWGLSFFTMTVIFTAIFWSALYSAALSKTRTSEEIEDIMAPRVGFHLMLGNAVHSRGLYSGVFGLKPDPKGHVRDSRRIAEYGLDRRLSHREMEHYWVNRVSMIFVNHLKTRPLLAWNKFFLTFNHWEVPNSQCLVYWRQNSILLSRIFWDSGFFIALGIAGFFYSYRRRDFMCQSLRGLIVVCTLGLMCTFVSADYRLPIYIPLFVFAGAFLDRFISLILKRSRKTLIALFILTLFSTFVYWPSGHVEGGYEVKARAFHNRVKKKIERLGEDKFRKNMLVKPGKEFPVMT